MPATKTMRTSNFKRMLSILLTAVMCVSFIFCLSGCGRPEDAVHEAIEDYAAAITAKDINAYMACIDSGSADININSLKAAMESIFASYDLKVSVVESTITTFDEAAGTASVVAVIEYINTGDAAYVDNRVTGEYILVNKEGKWLITNSIMQSVEYLDDVPASDSDVMYSVPDEVVSGGDAANDALSAAPNTEEALG